ncbi:probable disease resistance protein At5g63020 [Malus domestica]|uniref:probable disease resistance protein At5g63020 n=1 Tax=Malus domestica TaxID=3750 RepID=UPI0039766486
MDIVIQIVVKVAEYAVEPAIGQVGYLAHCKRNLENLQTQVNELSAAREALELEVVRAEEKGEEIQTDVQNWLKDVVEITEKASKLWKRDTQAKMSCLHGVCPNPVLRYKLGRRSTKLQLAVFNLYAKRDFASISYNVRPQEVSMVFDKHYEAFDLRTLTVKKIMDELRIPNTNLILVYGIGGLGKTTLVEEVHRQAVKAKLFADAVMVRSVQNPDLQGIQKEIAIKLEKRSQKDFALQVLNEEDAWSLYETKAGDVKNPGIRIVATDVAKKCGGLPLLVVTVASSSRNRSTLPVSKDALRCLKVFDNEDSAEQEAYSALEWTYNQLDDQKLKPLFLICGILVHGGYAHLTDLLNYTIGLGLFKHINSVDAQHALHSRIEELKDSCLLLDSKDNTSITMHDLLRDVAISIASKGHRALLRAKGDTKY